MNRVLIFCEGVTDQVFIADCLEVFYGIIVERKVEKKNVREGGRTDIKTTMTFDKGAIIDIGGCDNLKMDVSLEQLRENTAESGVNLVIFDADEKGRGNNSFENATRKLEDIKKNHQTIFNYYLWPNHEKDGEVEDVILNLIVPQREAVMQCIKAHQKCLNATGFEDLRQSTEKDLIRFYLYTNNIDKSEARYANYKDTRLWNLNPDDTPDLKKFKNFLDPYFNDVRL